MFIRAYLRASTEDQFSNRAKEMLEQFVQEWRHKIASYYQEDISGTKLDQLELGRLLMNSHRNDILLVEQIDWLTRLSNSDWVTLKKLIKQHELRIVSLDVPTSWQALSDKDPSQADQERHQKVLYYRQIKKLSIRKTADATNLQCFTGLPYPSFL